MSSYIVDTSYNGAPLEDLNALTYTSINPQYSSSNIIPVLGTTYQLKNNRKQVVSNNLDPYQSPQVLSLPGLMTCDSNNVLYVTNTNGEICKLVNDILQQVTTSPRIFPNIPRGLAFDASGILYVSAEEYVSTDISGVSGFYFSQIYKIDKNGNLTVFNISGTTLDKVRGIAFDAFGHLYITDQGNNCIIKVIIQDYDNGIGSIIVPYYIGLNGPTDITFDAFNNMFIANTNDNNIIQFSANGTISVFAGGLSTPCSLRFDINGILYVTCFADSTQTSGLGYVLKIVNNYQNQLSIDGVSLTHPYGIAFDSSNNMYVTNTSDGYGLYFYGDNQIYKAVITYQGTPYYQNLGAEGNNNLIGNITGLAFDTNQNMYACLYYPPVKGDFPYPFYPPQQYISYYGVVYKVFDNNESTLYYNNAPTVVTLLQNPKGIAFDINGYAYVINISSNNVVKIAPGGGDTSGTILDISGAQLDNPSDLGFDYTGTNLYVTNYLSDASNAIVVIDVNTGNSTVLTYTGVPINGPTALFVDFNTSNIYVSNSGSNNILLLSYGYPDYTSTVYNATLGSATQIEKPLALTLDLQGVVYFSNENNNNIGVITNNGYVSNLNIVFDTSYSLIINSSSYIIYDSQNNLYISNQSNISIIGDINPVIKLTCNISGTEVYNSVTNSLNGASYVNSDSSGNTYVYCINDIQNNIKIVTPENSCTVYASSSGYPTSIIGMCFDNYQLLYILDAAGDILYQIDNQNNSTQLYLNLIPPATIFSLTNFIFDKSNNMYIANANNGQFAVPPVPGNGNILVAPFGPQPNPEQGSYDTSILESNLQYLPEFNPAYIVLDTNGIMYITNFLSANIIGQQSSGYVFDNYIYRLNVNDTNNGITYATLPVASPTESTISYANGITIDSTGYLYIMIEVTYGYVTSPQDAVTDVQNIIYITTYPVTSANGSTSNTLVPFYTYPSQPFSLFYTLVTLQYNSQENSLLTCYSNPNSSIDKLYLSYHFNGLKLGKYNDTLTINNVYDDTVNPVTTFYVYKPYVVLDPSNIPVNTPAELTIHFVIPQVLPNPVHSYTLIYNGTVVSDVMQNNSTIVQPKQISGSTYPTGICNDSFGNLYVALQNNTISFVNIFGDYFANFVPASYGLLGPTNLAIDASNIIYVLNSTGTFISKVQSNAQVVVVNNDFYTGVSNPISLVYDYISNDSLYLLTGITPNFQITRIPIADPSNATILPLPLGSLYNPKGMVIDQFDVTGPKYLYISQVNVGMQNEILRVNLTAGPSPIYYQLQPFITDLEYTPYSMSTKSDGFLYVNDTTSNVISKISITDPYGSSLQDWLTTCIYVPIATTFNIDGNLYVANSGTNPNNNKITKVYVDYFDFVVSLNVYGSVQVSLYDMTTKTYVPNGTFTITAV